MKHFAFAVAAITAANAYDQSLANCQSFAAQFDGTCGGETEGDAFPDVDASFTGWGTGSSITCAPYIYDSPDESVINCPNNGGSSANTCTVTRKNCVTCRENGAQVYIRYQSNGMPTHCYGSYKDGGNTATDDYPQD